jgi:hypothetical protein
LTRIAVAIWGKFISLHINVKINAYEIIILQRHINKKRITLSFLLSENRQILKKAPRREVKTLTLWRGLFTRLWCYGVWRYLRSVDRVFSPRFLLSTPQMDYLVILPFL